MVYSWAMATFRMYRVTVRVVYRGRDAFDTETTVTATNSTDADRNAERVVRRDHVDARAVAAIRRRRVAS